MTLLNILIIILFTWVISFLIGVVTLPLHSILLLIALFTFVGICFMLIFQLPFIGTILIIVYVGAVAVLFIFIIIMIPQRIHQSRLVENKQIILMAGITILSLLVLTLLILNLIPVNFNDLYEVWISTNTEIVSIDSNALSLSLALYYKHPFSLVLAALLLFVAIAAAILICKYPDQKER